MKFWLLRIPGILLMLMLLFGIMAPPSSHLFEKGMVSHDLEETAKKAAEENDPVKEAFYLLEAGLAYRHEGMPKKAIEVFRESSQIYEALGDTMNQVSVFLELSKTHWVLDESEEAMQYFNIAGNRISIERSSENKKLYSQMRWLLTGGHGDDLGQESAKLLDSLRKVSIAQSTGNVSTENDTWMVSGWWLILPLVLLIFPFLLWIFSIQNLKKEQVKTEAALIGQKNAHSAVKLLEGKVAAATIELNSLKQEKAKMEVTHSAELSTLEVELRSEKSREILQLHETHSEELRQVRQSNRAQLAQMEKELERQKLDILIAEMSGAGNFLMTLEENWLNKVSERFQGESLAQVQSFWDQEWRQNEWADWDRFAAQFDKCFLGFTKRLALKYPSLTDHDLRICALLKVDMASKDMAILLKITAHAVDVARYRIRKKMNLERSEGFMEILDKI